MAYWDEYTWIVVVGALAAVFMAYGIGANDVANAFATSVGSKALKLWQAVILAGIFEFGGAVLLGRGVTSTIKSSIIERGPFEREPEILMYGMLCALIAAGTWLLVATYFEMPVSTTHSIIGGIVGYALVSKGPSSVNWYTSTDTGIRIEGIAAIVLSWVISPVCSGIIAALIFFIVRTFVMRANNAYSRVFIFFPVLVFFTVWINLFYVLDKGVTKQVDIDFNKSLWISCVSAAGAGILVGCCMPLLRKHLDAQAEKAAAITATGVMLTEEEAKAQGVKGGNVVDKTAGQEGKGSSWFNNLSEGVQHDVHGVIDTDSKIAALHANAEVFDPKAESGFRYLQIFTACCDSFAHGANDVANAIGPFSAIWEIYRHGKIRSKSTVPIWILVLGGFGIVVGLGTYGYNIIRAIGVKMIKITPSRGFSIELGSALVVVTGSRLELPLSTTHCQVGATVAVGMLEHGAKGVNWPLFAKTCVGWVFTLIIVGLISAVFMAFGVYTPNLVSAERASRISQELEASSLKQIARLRACNTTPGFQENLDLTESWVVGAAGTVQHPNRIVEAEQYTSSLITGNTNIVCADNFVPLPEAAAIAYPLEAPV